MAKVQTVVGRVGRVDEQKTTPTGKTVLGFSVAENVWDPDAREEVTRWYECSAWEADALVAAENLQKGMRIYVRGRYSEFEGTSGTKYQINVDEFGAADQFRAGDGTAEW